jgi:hypothetical protein
MPGRAYDEAAQRPFYLAHALVAYQRKHGLDDAALADFLGCFISSLPRLGLCRKPESREEVERVAWYAGCAPNQLAQVLDDLREDKLKWSM